MAEAASRYLPIGAAWFVDSVALLMLPRANPEIYAGVTLRMPLIVQHRRDRLAAVYGDADRRATRQ